MLTIPVLHLATRAFTTLVTLWATYAAMKKVHTPHTRMDKGDAAGPSGGRIPLRRPAGKIQKPNPL